MLQTARTPDRDHDPVRRLLTALVVSALLLAAFGVLTVLVAGPLRPLDVALNAQRDISAIEPTLTVVDRIGQRAVCLPLLAFVAWMASRRAGSWRPLIVAGVSVVAVNLFVAVFKFSLERGAPLQGEPGFLEGGVMYPSGHTANVVLVYGLAAFLWWRYTDAARRTRVLLSCGVVALTVVMVMTSLTLRWHWFTDLVAGVLVGAAALRTATAVDRAIPSDSGPHLVEPTLAARGPVEGRAQPPDPVGAVIGDLRYRGRSRSARQARSAAQPGPGSRG